MGEIKVKLKFDLRKYYIDEIKRLDCRMNVFRNACLEKLKSLSTLYEQSAKLRGLLERIDDPESKSKHSPLPRKMIDGQSQIVLMFPKLPIEKTSPPITSSPSSLPNNLRAETAAKTYPPVTSPPSSLPNNSRADGLDLFGNKNWGEGVSEGVAENTHRKFGSNNFCRFSEEYISGMLEQLFPQNYKVARSSEWDLNEKVSAVLHGKSK